MKWLLLKHDCCDAFQRWIAIQVEPFECAYYIKRKAVHIDLKLT